MGQGDRDDGAALAAEAFEGAFHRGADLRVEALAEVLGRHADPQASDGGAERPDVVFARMVRGRGVQRVRPGDHAEHRGRILH